jgi:hypothetical protein
MVLSMNDFGIVMQRAYSILKLTTSWNFMGIAGVRA